MTLSSYFANFFAGLFLCNCIPHLATGLCGMPFPTPFAKPRGVGKSSPVVNFLWGMFNLAIGVGLLAWRPLILGPNLNTLLFLVAFVMIGLHLSLHFGRVMRGKD